MFPDTSNLFVFTELVAFGNTLLSGQFQKRTKPQKNTKYSFMRLNVPGIEIENCAF